MELNMKHNLSKHKGYSVWRQIRERCHNTSHKHYYNYGARGISLFNDWRTDVTSFINYISNFSLRNVVSVVPQQIDLFSGNVVENIALGEDLPDIQQ